MAFTLPPKNLETISQRHNSSNVVQFGAATYATHGQAVQLIAFDDHSAGVFDTHVANTPELSLVRLPP